MDYVAIVSFLNALQQQFVEDPGPHGTQKCGSDCCRTDIKDRRNKTGRMIYSKYRRSARA